MTEVFDLVTEQAAFVYNQSGYGLVKGSEDFIDMCDVLLDGVRVYIDVDKIYQSVSSVKSRQDEIQCILECGWCVG